MLNHISEDLKELDILQLKNNVLPRGSVPLEELFDFNIVGKNPKIERVGSEVEDCNIGTDDNTMIVNIYKSLYFLKKDKSALIY